MDQAHETKEGVDAPNTRWRQDLNEVWQALRRLSSHTPLFPCPNGRDVTVGQLRDLLACAMAHAPLTVVGEPTTGEVNKTLTAVGKAGVVYDGYQFPQLHKNLLERFVQLKAQLGKDDWKAVKYEGYHSQTPVSVEMPFCVWETLCQLKKDMPELVKLIGPEGSLLKGFKTAQAAQAALNSVLGTQPASS